VETIVNEKKFSLFEPVTETSRAPSPFPASTRGEGTVARGQRVEVSSVKLFNRLSAICFCALWVASPSYAHDPANHAHTKEKQSDTIPQAAPVATKISIPDLPVVNQDGGTQHFYKDLVKGKLVAINFIYTTCTTICPPLGAGFSQIQDRLGARLGAEVFLISVTVDPVVDTPARLKAWGKKFHAKPGWTLVTGNKRNVDNLLKAVGAFTPAKETHAPIVLLGNEAAGTWLRTHGLTPADKVVELIDRLGGKTERISKLERTKAK